MSSSSNTADRAEPKSSNADEGSSDAQQHVADPLRPVNKRLSIVSGTPAEVSTDSPDVHVSLVQPGGSLATPNPEASSTGSNQWQAGAAPITDYFTAASKISSHAVGAHDSTSPESAAHNALSRTTTRSSDTAGRSNPEHFYMDSNLEHKLAVQRETIAAASASKLGRPSPEEKDADAQRIRPRRSVTDHPHYPNQSLAALSSQIHPENHHAPYSSRPAPGRYHASKPSGILSRISSPSNSGDERQARTVGNTPIQTPGLFSPRVQRYPTGYGAHGEDSPVPSPYLHPVQPQAPKETSKAVRDTDTSSGRKTINQYEIMYELGKGTHGKVKLARNTLNGEYVAIKIVQRFAKRHRLGKAARQEDKVKKEIAILKKALHPNVVGMVEVIDDPDLHKIYLVLEFCEAHDVRWRTNGENEVILLEHCRLLLEKRGEAEPESDADVKKLERSAKKGLARAQKHHRPQLSRIGSESEFWSLEYAGDSEPDDDEVSMARSPAASRIISRSANRSFAGTPDDTGSPMSMALSPAPEPLPSGHAPGCPEDKTKAESGSPRKGFFDFQDFHEQMQQRLDDQVRTHGEEARGRKPSLAESTSSALSDAVEKEVPGELRFVPLLTVPETRRAFRDALLGIEYLHYQGIIHRDIKPENLLRKADHYVKISDFGVSYLGKPIREGRESEETSDAEGSEYQEDETELAKTVGTPAFYAPELCDLGFTEDKPRVTYQIDVWALGVTLYCFLFARLPFEATNEFHMMRQIAEDDIFISRKRLKAVDLSARSRPGSHGPQFRSSKDHRLAHEVQYEEIDDELYDLLSRLLIKDPGKRITVQEIKVHPWVIRDIPNHVRWLDETNPHNFSQGRKIEISNQEIHEAVAPLRLVERAKSVVKKAIGGLTGGFTSGSRRRGQSSAASSEASSSPGPWSPSGPPPPSHHSRSEESIATILKGAREQQHHQNHPEHPLSQSVTASPELSPSDKEARSLEDMRPRDLYELSRPPMPDRQESVMSTAASVRTVRQSDYTSVENALEDRPPMPTEQQHPGHIFGMLGEAGRTLLRSVRSRDRNAPEGRSTSSAPSPKSSDSAEHLQGPPSVAVSNTAAAGQLVRHTPSPTATHKRASVSSHPIASGHHRGFGEQSRHSNTPLTQAYLPLSSASPEQPFRAPVRPPVSSNSSDDHFNPAISRETSFPSVPSVVSADSSVVPDASYENLSGSYTKLDATGAPQATVSFPRPDSPSAIRTPGMQGPLVLTSEDDLAGHSHAHGEQPETDEDDSDSDEDVLVMSRSKSRAVNSKSSVRSGSTNTVKKRSSGELPQPGADNSEMPRGRKPSQEEQHH